MNLSRRSLLLLGLCVVLTLSATSSLVRAGNQDFVLVNKTGYDIDEVYVAPANEKDWGEDIMGKDTLDNGDKVTIEFSHKEKECAWDMKIVFSDKEEAVWEDFDLCKVREITLHYEGKRPTATFK
ncbi:MAG: hypothetical protein ABI565_12295 [Vicinamibacteria bacterium]